MINHCTSDVLVPVDQISRSCTYPRPGMSLPKEFDMRLPRALPGKLKYSLEELLPKKQVRVTCIQVPENAPECILPYDSGKQFNINLFDDGPAEGYGTHSSKMDTGRRLDVPYLREMFEKTSMKTCFLTPAMMKRLMERYEGKSIALPVHEGVDDCVYGSLKIYQKEAAEELAEWKKYHGDMAFEAVFDEMLESEKENVRREELRIVMKKMESMFDCMA